MPRGYLVNHSRRVGLVAAVGVALLGATPTSASMLGLVLSTAPRVEVATVSVNYNIISHIFQVNGVAGSLETPPADPGPDYSIQNGTFSISLNLHPSNNGTLISGSLTIGGEIASIGATPSPLLTGTATGFGFPNPPGGGNAFDFLFTVNGGTLSQLGCGAAAASPCFPLGNSVYVVVSTFGSAFPGTFTNPYSNTNFANVASAAPPTPEPTGVALAGLTLAALLINRPRHRAPCE